MSTLRKGADVSVLRLQLIDGEGYTFWFETNEENGTKALETYTFVKDWAKEKGYTLVKYQETAQNGSNAATGAPETKMCEVHSIEMPKGWSKKKNKPYWSHRNAENKVCFGQGYLD